MAAFRSLPLDLGNGMCSMLTGEIQAENLTQEHSSQRHQITKTLSLNSNEIRSRNESDKPIFVINLDKENRTAEKSLMQNDKIFYVTYQKGFDSPQTFMNFVKVNVSDLSKDVWILARKTFLADGSEFNTFIHNVKSFRGNAMKRSNITSGGFPIQVLLTEPMKSFPWKGDTSVSLLTLEHTNPQGIVQTLVAHYKNRLVKISNLLGLFRQGIYYNLEIRLNLSNSSADLIVPDIEYLQNAYLYLREIVEDPHTSFRQQLQQLHKIPSVRVSEINEGIRGRDMYMVVELRPLTMDGLISLVEQVRSGQIALILEENYLNFRRESFDGHIDVTANSSVEPVRNFLIDHKYDGMPSLNKLKGMIVTQHYKNMLKDERKTPYDFLMYLKKIGQNNLITDIRENDGSNALHMAVQEKRLDFLQMVFYLNRWGELHHEIINVSHPNSYAGYTPRRLAEALSFKTKGQLVLDEFDYLEHLYTKMNVLEKASLDGRLDVVKLLAAAEPRLLKSTSLFYACGAGHHEIVDFLMVHGVDHHKTNSKKENCLQMAARFGHTNVLLTFVKRSFDIRGKGNADGFNAFDYCVMNGDIESIKLFKQHGFPIEANALVLAARYNRKNVFNFLSHEHKLSVSTGKDKDDRSPIHHAVVQGNIETLSTLLDLDMDIRAVDKYNKNVLHFAAENKREDFVKYLMLKIPKEQVANMVNSRDIYTGKDLYFLVRGKDRGRRAWHWIQLRRLYIKLFKDALAQGQIDVAQHGEILFSGFGSGPPPEINKKIEDRQRSALETENRKPDMTPLHYAVNHQHLEITDMLLSKGADPNIQDYFGATPLHHAAIRGNLEILKLLVNYRGRLDIKTNDGKDVLAIASENNHTHLLHYIEGRPMIQTAENFLHGPLKHAKEELGMDSLTRRRANGEDLKRHVVATLRELTISVNLLLMEIGSGPILEASEDA